MSSLPTIPLTAPTLHGDRFLNQKAPEQANNQQISGSGTGPAGQATVGGTAGSIGGPGQGVNAGSPLGGSASAMPSGFVDEDWYGTGPNQARITRGDNPSRVESGYGFRARIPEPPGVGYDPVTGTPPPAAEPEIIDNNPFTDENPYDDDGGSPYHAPSFTAGATNRGSFAGVQNAGLLGYDGSDQARMGVANQLGYQQGQTGLGGLAGVAGMALGIPGAGFIADKVIPDEPTEPVTVTREDGSTYTDARDRSYGAVGTTDSRGNVFSQDGVAYDPVTGQRVKGVFRDRATATPHIKASLGFEPEGYEAPPETAAEAGLMSIAGNDSIARVLDDATIASTPEIGRASVAREINADRKAAGQSYTHTDDDGGSHEIAAGRSAVTDRHGNAVTNTSAATGKTTAVTSTNYGGNDDNDSGGGGGGGK